MVAFASLHVGLLPFILFLQYAPLSVFRYSRIRSACRTALRHQLAFRLALFPLSMFAAFFDGFMLSVLVTLFGAICGAATVLLYTYLKIGRPLRRGLQEIRVLKAEVEQASPKQFRDTNFKEVIEKQRVHFQNAARKGERFVQLWGHRKFDFRPILIPTAVIAASILLGKTYAAGKLENNTPAYLPTLKIEARLMGRSENYLIFVGSDYSDVFAVTVNGELVISLAAQKQNSD